MDEFEALTHCGSWQSNLVNLVEPIAPGGVPKVELFSMVSEVGTAMQTLLKVASILVFGALTNVSQYMG